jgi:hypothetical protein
MSYYPDLAEETELAHGPDIRAVGWLAQGRRYPTGQVPQDIQKRLDEHVASAWQPVIAAGIHVCDLCEGRVPPHPAEIASGSNVLIPSDRCLYIAPALIVHYIHSHSYRPPQEFLDAVAQCPPQGSQEYVTMIEPFLYHWRVGT